MNFQPPDPNGFGHCLTCHCGIEESEQSGGVCIECQITAAGNEPAFPVGASEYGGHGTVFGVTVRDFFAAKAMQGVLANDGFLETLGEGCNSQNELQLKLAKASYRQAEAMLIARSE